MDFNIQMSQEQHKIVDGVESWISCQGLRPLKKANHWQKIQWRLPADECDIQIGLNTARK